VGVEPPAEGPGRVEHLGSGHISRAVAPEPVLYQVLGQDPLVHFGQNSRKGTQMRAGDAVPGSQGSERHLGVFVKGGLVCLKVPKLR
jgi:hypothetical protein